MLLVELTAESFCTTAQTPDLEWRPVPTTQESGTVPQVTHMALWALKHSVLRRANTRAHARTPLISPLRAHKSEKNDPVRDGVTISLLSHTAQGPRTRAAGPQRAAARAAGAGVSK